MGGNNGVPIVANGGGITPAITGGSIGVVPNACSVYACASCCWYCCQAAICIGEPGGSIAPACSLKGARGGEMKSCPGAEPGDEDAMACESSWHT